MYIYENEAWPDFEWNDHEISKQLGDVRHRQGLLLGQMSSMGFKLRAESVLQALTEETVQTSSIEGETLDKDQVRSSIARNLGLDIAGMVPSDRNVDGVVEMMIDATQNYDKPLTKARLCRWHAALFPTGRSGMNEIVVGDWRKDKKGPMRVVSGPIGRETIHFEAPSAKSIGHEMATFFKWFESKKNVDPVIAAAVAHLWFITIHPFEDGNGRIARAITDMALARSENTSQRFYSMSSAIRYKRKDYYTILERTQKSSLDISEWLKWFLGCFSDALDQADHVLDAVLIKSEFWGAHKNTRFNERQQIMIERLLDGFIGKLTSSKWAKITKISQDTAARDIDDLIKKGVLTRSTAGGRSTSYELVLPKRQSDL